MAKLINLTGQRFGKLTVIDKAPNKNNKVIWNCQCDCGNICKVRGDQLRGGITKSCGCLHIESAKKIGKNNFKDLTGQRFGKLVAIEAILDQNTKKYKWICQCDCGNIVTVLGTSLTSHNTQSCGCIKSIGENNIQSLLNTNNINFIYQYRVIINNMLYIYDFALIQNNKVIRLIEFDGIQHTGKISGWFTEERRNQLENSDKIKNSYAKEHNIPLVRIPYFERDKITLELLLGDKYLINTEMDSN